MCGITGSYNWDVPERVFHDLVEASRHRGPDAEGSYASPGDPPRTRLGFRRLAIIDLSDQANQPFRKNGLVLVFNGEIYNFRELKASLETEGARFRTSSDTEVVLEAWNAWGPACLGRFRGMFAFGVYDERTEKLALARDPFGIKPLFVARRPDGLAFASELKALRPILSAAELEIDPVAFAASLLYSWVPENHCIHRGVSKLAPGHWLEIDPSGRVSSHCYYDPVAELVEAPLDPVSPRELGEILADSVRSHLVADVPVSSFLSGGLDSSLVTVMASKAAGSIDAYTIAFREEDRRLEAMPDDLAYARRVAERHDVPLHVIEIDPDLAEMLPFIVRTLDEPIGDAAALNAYLICRAARDAGVKVLLSGMGADEIFAGYRKHLACKLATHYRRLPGPLRKGIVEPLVARLPVAGRRRGYRTVRWAKRFLSFAGLEEAHAFQRSYTHYDVDELGSVLPAEFEPALQQLMEEHAILYRRGPRNDMINRMCFTDTNLFLPSLNLAYTDRASMAASTEVRVPFVDVEVVRAAFSVPGSRKIRGRHGKEILKRAAEPYLERDIIRRPKGLFSAPLRAWIRRDLTELVDDLLPNGKLVQEGLVDGDWIGGIIERDRAMMEDNSKQVWHLLTLETWYRDHLEDLGRAGAGTARDAQANRAWR